MGGGSFSHLAYYHASQPTAATRYAQLQLKMAHKHRYRPTLELIEWFYECAREDVGGHTTAELREDNVLERFLCLWWSAINDCPA